MHLLNQSLPFFATSNSKKLLALFIQGVFSLPIPMGKSYLLLRQNICYVSCFFCFSFWGKH